MTDYDVYVKFFTRIDEPIVMYDIISQELLYGKIVDFERRTDNNEFVNVMLEVEDANGNISKVSKHYNEDYTLLRIVRLTSKYFISAIKKMSFEQLLKECIMPGDKFQRLFFGDAQNWNRHLITQQGITLEHATVSNIVSRKSFTCKIGDDEASYSDKTKYNLETGIAGSKHFQYYIDMILFRKLNCYDADWLHEIENYVIISKNLKYDFSTLTPEITEAAKKMHNQMKFVQEYLNSREFLLNEERFKIEVLDAIS